MISAGSATIWDNYLKFIYFFGGAESTTIWNTKFSKNQKFLEKNFLERAFYIFCKVQ
jgi:hypothetical protein